MTRSSDTTTTERPRKPRGASSILAIKGYGAAGEARAKPGEDVSMAQAFSEEGAGVPAKE